MFSAIGGVVKAGEIYDLRFTIYAVEGKAVGIYDASMPDDAHEAVQKKVEAIFAELVGDRGLSLQGHSNQTAVRNGITSAYSSDKTPEVAREIAFHMTDWSDDAAFVVALHLFPERFTPEEIEAGIGILCAHVQPTLLQRRGSRVFPQRIYF